MRRLFLITVILTALLTAACGGSFPADPDHTLEQVTGGVLRVGVSHNPPYTVTGAADPTGTDVALARDFAASLPAEIEWTVGGEEMLILALERGDLDLVVGGLTADTPWSEHAAITKPYAETRDTEGEKVELVMAARPGENAFLLRLEKFLLGRRP